MIKYKLYVFFSFLVLVCLVSFGQAKTVKEPLYQKTIFLDAGHGGYLYTLQNKTSIKPYNIMVFEFF